MIIIGSTEEDLEVQREGPLSKLLKALLSNLLQQRSLSGYYAVGLLC